MKRFVLIAPVLFIAACTTGPAPSLPPAAADTCGAAQYANLIGQDATALERVLIMGEVRIIRPGQAVTMDFRPNRINFGIGPNNAIRSVSCN